MDTAEIKDLVRARYGSIAAAASSACCAPATACCGPAAEDDLTGFDAKASRMGYS
jgi:arsenite methyltransferase